MGNPASRAQEGAWAEQLQRLLLAIEASGRAILPSSNDELLQTIVEAAARLFGAAAASIALVNEKQQTLDFKVSTGIGREQVVGMRIPLDQGIAGYVAMTGQPMAISNVQQDPRFVQETAEKTGYVPRSILAMPLLSNDRVIGVIEVLDKINAPSFGMQDMELLGIFARQAAIAIHSSQQYERLGEVLLHGLQDLVNTEGGPEIKEALDRLAERPGEDDRAADLMALADLFKSIYELGEAERKAGLRILAALADYTRSRPRYA
jgi:GAF domain-containing protein